MKKPDKAIVITRSGARSIVKRLNFHIVILQSLRRMAGQDFDQEKRAFMEGSLDGEILLTQRMIARLSA